ncbi:MAG: hypothetical protein ABSG57_05320 [Candidatus Bathyarchaeia archaeon]
MPSFIQDLGTLVSEDNHLTQNDFNKILLSAVDEGLCLLGDSSKQAILFHLETSFQVKEENIPSNLTEFKKALDSIFGPGADYLEKIIVKRLHEKLGLRFEEGKNTDFLEYVQTAKSRIIKKGEITLK